MYDEAVVRRFYKLLGHKHETEVRVIPADGGRPSSHFVHNANQFHHICSQYNGKAHVYAGINERCRKGTGSKDVSRINSIVFDIDVSTPENCGATYEEMQQAVATATAAWDWVQTNNIHPCPVRIGSGNGCYLWLCVPPVTLRGQRHRRAVREKLRQFAESMAAAFDRGNVKVDTKVTYDFARIIRVPGTRNIKGIDCPDPNRSVGRYAFEIDPLYRVESPTLLKYLDSAYVVSPPPAGQEGMEAPDFQRPADELLRTLYDVCPRIRGLAGGGGAGDITEIADYYIWLYFGANLVKLAGQQGAEEWERVSRQAPGYNPDDFDQTRAGNKVTEILERFEGVPGCSSLRCPLVGTPKACGVNTPMGMVWRRLKGRGRAGYSVCNDVFARLGFSDLEQMARATYASMLIEKDKVRYTELNDYYNGICEQIGKRVATQQFT
jgi:hypothetical protein